MGMVIALIILTGILAFSFWETRREIKEIQDKPPVFYGVDMTDAPVERELSDLILWTKNKFKEANGKTCTIETAKQIIREYAVLREKQKLLRS